MGSLIKSVYEICTYHLADSQLYTPLIFHAKTLNRKETPNSLLETHYFITYFITAIEGKQDIK